MGTPLGLTHPDLQGKALVSQRELSTIITALPDDGRLLEIGTYHGVTAAMVSMARPNARLLCVDPFITGDADNGVEGDEVIWSRNAQPNMRLHVGTSVDLAMIVDNLFDVVLVDGCHNYENCLLDLRVCSAVIKKGGVLLAHDYGRIPGERVTKAVDEFVGDSVWQMTARVDHMAVMRRAS
ncbi:MAG: class I SAM-dependent methyltransferase [Deltaproteobacteria bacterium]|nr:class I SAM-dependent methyltransferase [Deltaproteobacteria bacterium]